MKPVLCEPLESRTLLSGAMLVKDIIVGPESSVSLSQYSSGSLGNKFFFPAVDETHGIEPWVSDGTATGTLMLADINVGDNSFPQGFAAGNGFVYFTANNGTSTQIWKSDGTPAGTTPVTAIPNAPGTRLPVFTVFSNNTLFFTENGDFNSSQLWATDGSAPGAEHLLTDFGGASNAGPIPMGAVNGTLFFAASGEGSGSQLWASDGSSLGTRQVKVLEDGHSIGLDGIIFNNQLYFYAFAFDGVQLWVSNGTDAGTHQVGTLAFDGSAPSSFTVSSGALYFSADDGTNGQQIYSTDGATITQVTSFPSAVGGGITDLTDVNGTLYFTRSSGGNPRRLYRLETDGTPFPIPLAADGGGNSANSLCAVGSIVFFVAQDKNSQYTLFQSDGQTISLVGPDNTVGQADRGLNQLGLTNVSGTLFYSADFPATGRELHTATPTTNTELTLTLGGSNISIDQGQKTPVAFHGTLTGATALRWGWDFTGTGKLKIFGKNGHSPTFNYSKERPQSIEVRCVVRTTDGRLIEATQFLEIKNVKPTVAVTANIPTAVPYLPVAFTANWTDPGFNEKFNVKWTFSDGEVIEQYVGTKLHRAKIIKIFTSPSFLASAQCEVTDANNGTGSQSKFVPVVKASVETIRRLATLFVGGTAGGSTISVAPAANPPPAPTGMKWVELVINNVPEGQFLINNAVKIYASASDVVDVEAGAGLIYRIIRSKLN